jgi:integrase/recombinase XerD
MGTATVSAFIDSYHPKTDGKKNFKSEQEKKEWLKKNGKCALTIRITHNKIKRYYPTGLSLKPKDFERIMSAKRRGEPDTIIYNKIHSFEDKAIKAVEALPIFTFGNFENIYLSNREAADSVSFGFEKYIKELKEDKRIGTSVSFGCAMKSINNFKSDLKYADVTSALLRKYENWMIENENTLTTVGIYLRSLRAVFNRANIDKSLYPFGQGKNKYSIPEGRNIKKALNLKEIAEIFKHAPEAGSTAEMAKDYWTFIYLCNGLNVKDLCLLKRKNIDGEIIMYHRAKTKRSKKQYDKIVISLKPEAKAVIKRWGQPSINPESYVFPHLHKGLTAEQERKIVQQLTKTINKYMKVIAKELKINKPCTSYYARHSFAQVLKNSGASMEFISEALGHSDMKTTRNYLDGFENVTIHKTTDALTAFS